MIRTSVRPASIAVNLLCGIPVSRASSVCVTPTCSRAAFSRCPNSSGTCSAAGRLDRAFRLGTGSEGWNGGFRATGGTFVQVMAQNSRIGPPFRNPRHLSPLLQTRATPKYGSYAYGRMAYMHGFERVQQDVEWWGYFLRRRGGEGVSRSLTGLPTTRARADMVRIVALSRPASASDMFDWLIPLCSAA